MESCLLRATSQILYSHSEKLVISKWWKWCLGTMELAGSVVMTNFRTPSWCCFDTADLWRCCESETGNFEEILFGEMGLSILVKKMRLPILFGQNGTGWLISWCSIVGLLDAALTCCLGWWWVSNTHNFANYTLHTVQRGSRVSPLCIAFSEKYEAIQKHSAQYDTYSTLHIIYV